MTAQQLEPFTDDPSQLPAPALPEPAPDERCAIRAWPCACSFARRRTAAGLDGGLPEGFEARHRLVFRLICMCIDEWRGCRERSCRRHRGCMAPSGVCINVRKDEPDANEEKFERASHHVYLTLRAEKRAHPELFPT